LKYLYIISDISNYHLARFNAFSRLISSSVVVVKYIENSGFKEFEYDKSNVGLWLSIKDISKKNYILKFLTILNLFFETEIVFLNGWSGFYNIVILLLNKFTRKKIVIFSETLALDKKRNLFIDFLKTQLISSAYSFLVGGEKHKAYLIKLGVDRTKIFEGYDVIDNNHFFKYSKLLSPFTFPYILCVGRLIERKNFLDSIKVLNLLHENGFTSIKLVIAGDGRCKEKLVDYAFSLGLENHIVIIGFKDYFYLPQLYNNSIAFLHLAKNEPWGLVVNEAMASQAVVFVGKNVGSSELIDDGVNGFLFDYKNHESVCLSIIKIINNKRFNDSLRRKAVMRIQRYSPILFANSLLKAINNDS
jgi:1,2-diacylglycerol 3-alpha-glucosyltransferase